MINVQIKDSKATERKCIMNNKNNNTNPGMSEKAENVIRYDVINIMSIARAIHEIKNNMIAKQGYEIELNAAIANAAKYLLSIPENMYSANTVNIDGKEYSYAKDSVEKCLLHIQFLKDKGTKFEGVEKHLNEVENEYRTLIANALGIHINVKTGQMEIPENEYPHENCQGCKICGSETCFNCRRNNTIDPGDEEW